MFVFGSEYYYTGAVSYTHLDVYKRQVKSDAGVVAVHSRIVHALWCFGAKSRVLLAASRFRRASRAGFSSFINGMTLYVADWTIIAYNLLDPFSILQILSLIHI